MSCQRKLQRPRSKHRLVEILRTRYYIYDWLLHHDLSCRLRIGTVVVESIQLTDLED